MKILILHLSDIHITEKTMLLNTRAEKIIDSIKNLENDVVQVLIAVTGDIAFSGDETEYFKAANFFDALKKEVKSKLTQNVSFIIVPGNHDCKFVEGKEDARNNLIESIRTKEFKTIGDSIIDICLKNQENFFSYCFDMYCDKPQANTKNLYYQFVYGINEFKISLNCLNTSWISLLREEEQYGKLGFISDLIQDGLDSDFSISLLHHPLNWFAPNNSKELKRLLEKYSTIILTGHEHEPNQSGVYNYKGKKFTVYIEGGILNNNINENESSFNAIFVDIDNNAYKFYQLDYLDNKYFPEESSESWNKNDHSKTREVNKFKLADYQKDWLNDPGATIYYQYGDESLTLDEIFVYPELKETLSDEEVIQLDDRIDSETLLKVDPNGNRFFIVGSEFIGKTILLKKLYKELYNLGLIPIFIEGRDIKDTSPDSFRKLIIKCFKDQYNIEDLESLKQLDYTKLYILIDNFHQSSLSLKYKARFIDSNFIKKDGRQIYPNIILCGNDYLELEEFIYKEDDFENPLGYFKSYRLLPFGMKMRYKLIEKWYRNKRRNIEEGELIQKIEFAERLINSNLGNNYIPKYPLFILVHLHGIDLEKQTELKTSSYGYYYEYLIVTAISRKDSELLDSYLTYLTHFSYYLFERKAYEITKDEFEKFDIEVFRKSRRIPKDFTSILEFLKSTGIIDEKDNLYRIKHNFIYYFFLARYFRDTLPSKETRKTIIDLAEKLYDDENTNILIFLTHLSKDNFIVETLVKRSKRIFKTIKPLEMNNDCDSIDSLIETLPQLLVENDNIQKNREMHRTEMSKDEKLTGTSHYNNPSSEEVEKDAASADLITNLRLSIKALQVLGQVGKNYYGSLTILQLHELIEEAYLLGLRTINSFISFLESNTDAVVYFVSERLSEILKEKNINIDEEKKNDMAKKLTFSLCLMVVGSFIQRISSAVGTEKLNETYKELYGKYDWNSIKLIDVSIRLDQYHYFPIKEIIEANKTLKKKKLSNIVLKILVKFYLEMYPVSTINLQKVASELGLEMKTLRLIAHKQKTKEK